MANGTNGQEHVTARPPPWTENGPDSPRPSRGAGPSHAPRRSRARRVLGVIGIVVGTTVTFVAATVGGVLLHIDKPATRRAIATQVSSGLRGVLAGEIVVHHIGGIGLRGLSDVSATIRDPEGVQVLDVDGATVVVPVIDVAKSGLFGKGDIAIDVSSVSVRHADANLDADAKGNLRIANAFASKDPSPPKPAEPGGRGVRVEAPKVTLGHAWVHGTPPGAILVDTDLTKLEARAHYDEKLIRADLDHLGVAARAIPNGLDPHGEVRGWFAQPSPTGKEMAFEGAFDGDVGGMPTKAEAHMDGSKLDAVADVRDPGAKRVVSLAGDSLALKDDVSVHAEAHGVLPTIDALANVAAGKARADLDAKIVTGDTTTIDAKLGVRDVDLKAILANGPSSNLGLDAKAKVAIGPDGPSGEASVDTLPGRLDREALPKAEIRARFTKDTATARASIRDPRMPTEVMVVMNPDPSVKDGRIIDADVATAIPSLARVPVVGNVARGRAGADVKARVRLPAQTVTAEVSVRGDDLAKDSAHIKSVRATARVSGTAERPVVDAEVKAHGIASGAETIERVNAKAKVAKEGDIIVVRDADVEAIRNHLPVNVKSGLVRIGPNDIAVKETTLEGFGDPIKVEISKTAREIAAKVDAPKIELSRVGKLAGKNDLGGLASIKTDLKLRANGAEGTIHVEAKEVHFEDLKGADANIDVAIKERAIDLDANLALADAGTLVLQSQQLEIGGSPIDPKAWERASGRVRFQTDVDLAKAAALAPKGMLPLSELRGRLVAQGRIGRDDTSGPPEAQIHAHTLGLVIAGPVTEAQPTKAVTVKTPAPWRSAGTDIGLDVRTDASTGFVNAAFRATDRVGAIVALDAKTELPFDRLIADSKSAKAKVLHAPVSAKLVVPPRKLKEMPPILGIGDIPGEVDAVVEITGNAVDPRLDVQAHARGVQIPNTTLKGTADADVALVYDGTAAKLRAKLRAEGKELLDADARVDAKVADFVEPGKNADGTPKDPAWRASGGVKLASFPLESIPQLVDRRVRGRVSGDVRVDGLHEDARVAVNIGFEKLRLGRVAYKKAGVVAKVGDGDASARVVLDQGDGYLDASAKTGLAWGADLVPALDASRPIEASLKAKAFRAAAGEPFAAGALDSLDGRIDADAKASLDPKMTGAKLDGKITFRDGKVGVSAIGDEFRDVRATVTLSPDGTIKVDDVLLRGVTGEVGADALVKIDGTRLAKATAHVRIPEKNALALAMQGQPIGDVNGDINVDASTTPDGKNMSVVVGIPKFRVALSENTKSDVQSLEEHPRIHVGTYRDRKTFVTVPLDKEDLEPEKPADPKDSKLVVDVRLGNIEVVRGNMARVVVTGNPKIEIADKTRITGQVMTKEGTVDVKGKEFKVENATVTFNGEDPPNPVIVATAGWTARDGTRVFADVVGPVKTVKVNLRSEPARPSNEVLAMVLFGTADGANTAPPPGKQQDGTAKAAASVGGDFATEGLTDALDDLAGIKATARIDTSSSRNPRPELEFQVSQAVSVAFAYVLGTPPLSQPDKTFAKVDWRLGGRWSFEYTIGNRGTFVYDAIWQRRY